jgi:hypothetical protein
MGHHCFSPGDKGAAIILVRYLAQGRDRQHVLWQALDEFQHCRPIATPRHRHMTQRSRIRCGFVSVIGGLPAAPVVLSARQFMTHFGHEGASGAPPEM